MVSLNDKATREALACLIIDDPLLRPRYGCLDYDYLLQAMKDHDFFTEIAFIPRNYGRSAPGTVRLFADNPDRYAICVHGCDHLASEFGGEDYEQLRHRAATALRRMEEHKRRTGLAYDPVFVFPQGRFSSVAVKALKDAGYFAAFNSTIHAMDADEPPAIECRHPATTMYHEFPLFLRRYPRNRREIAEDMEAGRPIVLVEHHGAFRDGYGAITNLVDWINSLGKVKWTSLGSIAEYYLGREAFVTRPDAAPSASDLRLAPRVLLRRLLCEFRDNYIETSHLLNRIYALLRG